SPSLRRSGLPDWTGRSSSHHILIRNHLFIFEFIPEPILSTESTCIMEEYGKKRICKLKVDF
ncbi:hypothetical protein, partial [Methanosarcina sp.]|uniref:hypothetical protein n=1 Tax=Methanosarcina sp. TaxID=2213 RepID=UPI002AB91F08